MANETRFSRQELLFGIEGQNRIEATSVALVGVGGTGTQIAQSLVHLGIRRFVLIEPGALKITSKNRYIGHRHDDQIPGTSKLQVAMRMIRAVTPDADITPVPHRLESAEAEAAIAGVDVVFGCVDDEGPRFKLNNLCAKLGKRFIDVATEVVPGTRGERLRYGGRVFVCWERPGCLVCCGVLDMEDVARQLAGTEERRNRDAIYGVRLENPNGSGPSVVTLNGVIATIATTEFMVAVTGLRSPVRLTVYRADLGKFTVSKDEPSVACYTCGTAVPLGNIGAQLSIN
ncbi:MAG: HesA/MoeB/ThiF family protein [Terracidiphilus sp.]